MEEDTCRTMSSHITACWREWRCPWSVCTNLSVRAASTTESTPPENKMATRAPPSTTEPAPNGGPQPTVVVSWQTVEVTLGALSILDWMACWRTDSKCCASMFQSVSWVMVAMAMDAMEETGIVAFSLETDCWLPFSSLHIRYSEPWRLNVGSWTVALASQLATHCVEVTCVSLWRSGTTLESQFFAEGSSLFSLGNGTCRLLSLTILKCKHVLSGDNWSTISVSLWKQTSVKEDLGLKWCVRDEAACFWPPVNETAHLPPSRGSKPVQLQWTRRYQCQRG